ncbi:MAG: hypothetical protein ACAI38_01880 [Myxococcota bacterium]
MFRTDFINSHGLPALEGLAPGAVTVADPGTPQQGQGKVPIADVAAANKSRWISAGLYVAGGVVGGLARLGLRQWIPNYSSAATPLVNIGTQIAMSPGQQAIQLITTPISVLAYKWVYGGKQEGEPKQVRAIDPAYEGDLVRVYIKRSRLDTWVAGPVSDFGTYLQVTKNSCQVVSKRLQANDIDGAARVLASALFYDRQLWAQHQPEGATAYELMFIDLHSYFEGLSPAAIADLKKATIAEALRLDAGKDKGLEKYVGIMVDGLTSDKPPQALQQPWGDEAAALAISDHTQKDAGTWAKELIDEALDKTLRGKGWQEQMQIKKDFNKALKTVVKDLQELETGTGRLATPDELWRLMNSAMAKDAGKSLELKAALISVGVFVLLSGGATFAYAKALPLVPGWSQAGFGQIIPTVISYLTITARFGLEKFIAFGRALGWAGTSRATLGKTVDRDFRNMRVRTAMVDRRVTSWLSLFSNFTGGLQKYAIDAAALVQKGKIDQAAGLLAGMQKMAHQSFFYFWPFTKLMHRVFERIGPNFDGITKAQRDELATKVLARLEAMGTDKGTMATYHKPFIEGLLGRNVRVV